MTATVSVKERQIMVFKTDEIISHFERIRKCDRQTELLQ